MKQMPLENKPPRWHILYYLLAAFDLITIAFSLYLNHQILGIYSKSTRVNAEWVARAEQYDEISKLAAEVNAPGNDIFDSHDVALERKRKEEALSKYLQTFHSARKHLSTLQNSEQAAKLSGLFGQIEDAMNEMNREADLIFSFFERKDAVSAGKRMATMDRKFAELNRNLVALRKQVRVYQKDNLADQENEAHSLGRFEYLIAGTILLIVCIVAFYGHWLSKKIEETSSLINAQRISLENSARLASLGTMSAGIAHEINNPLAIIQGNADLLKTRIKNGEISAEAMDKSLDKIITTCERITKIVKGLRSFARDGAQDPPTPVPLTQIVEDSVAFCKERFKNHGVELRIQSPEENVLIQCRQVQICQVIVNLLNNAFDAVVSKQGAWVELSIRVADGKVVFFVKDSGKGIPPEIAAKLMQPFFTTKEVGKGTGLGLSISHGILKQHGGNLYLDASNPNTLFVVEIPIVPTYEESIRLAA